MGSISHSPVIGGLDQFGVNRQVGGLDEFGSGVAPVQGAEWGILLNLRTSKARIIPYLCFPAGFLKTFKGNLSLQVFFGFFGKWGFWQPLLAPKRWSALISGSPGAILELSLVEIIRFPNPRLGIDQYSWPPK